MSQTDPSKHMTVSGLLRTSKKSDNLEVAHFTCLQLASLKPKAHNLILLNFLVLMAGNGTWLFEFRSKRSFYFIVTSRANILSLGTYAIFSPYEGNDLYCFYQIH